MIRQTKPGLVTLYDIRPGNGAGPFLQPRSPHGAIPTVVSYTTFELDQLFAKEIRYPIK